MAEADPDGAGLKGSCALMGKGCTVQTCPDSDPPVGQFFCHFLAIDPGHKADRAALILPGKNPKAPLP